VPVCKTDISIFNPLLSLVYFEYRHAGQLASGNNFPPWINRYFFNFAIIVSGHSFSRIITWDADVGSFFVFTLSFNNYIEFTTYCSIAGGLVILRTIQILSRNHNLILYGNPKIGYPALANFISQIYNPKQFSANPFFPVPISNLLIAVGGHCFLEHFIGGKLHTYEFGYTGRLIEKIKKKHLDLIIFFIGLPLLLNVYDFSTFFSVVGCLLLIFTLINKQIK